MSTGTLVYVNANGKHALWPRCAGGDTATSYTRPQSMGIILLDKGGSVVCVVWNDNSVMWVYRENVSALVQGDKCD